MRHSVSLRLLLLTSTLSTAAVADELAPTVERGFKLAGVAVRSDGPSVCVIEDQRTNQQRLLRVGQHVGDGRTLIRVEWDQVTFMRDGEEDVLRVRAADGDRVRALAQSLDDYSYRVNRAQLDVLLADPTQFTAAIGIRPHLEAGVQMGISLSEIHAGSVFDQLGLRNGDVLLDVNGMDPFAGRVLLAMLSEVRSASSLRVGILRGNESLTLHYAIE